MTSASPDASSRLPLSAFWGLLIGAGGFNEWTVLGMGGWTLLQLRDRRQLRPGGPDGRDAVVVGIGILMLLYWAFLDPEVPGSLSGLTLPEVGKALVWMLFAPVLLRSDPLGRGRDLLRGLAAGLALYSGATLVGSLLTQPFQGSYGRLFNVFSGRLDAGSTEPGYVACGVLLLLLRLDRRWLLPALALALGYAVQARNRSALLVVAVVLLSLAWEQRAPLLAWWQQVRRHPRQLLPAVLPLTAVLVALARSTLLQRFGDLFTAGRAETHRVGFARLLQAYASGDRRGLATVPPGLTVHDQWWHNLPLDALRCAGFVGHGLALLWLLALLLAAWRWGRRGSTDGVVVALLALAILWTSLPLGVGHYELLSVLGLTLVSLADPPRR